jgi:hypothetical protein
MVDPHKAWAADYHVYVVCYDPIFHQFMDMFHGDAWRWWSDQDKRMAAKRFNFGRLYGNAGAGMKDIEILELKRMWGRE